MLHASTYGRGVVLNLKIDSPTYDTDEFDRVPLLDTVAVYDQEKEELTIFAVNRSQESKLSLTGNLRMKEEYGVVEHLVMVHSNPKATNTFAQPNVVVPHANGDAALRGVRNHGYLTAALLECDPVIARRRSEELTTLWNVSRVYEISRAPNCGRPVERMHFTRNDYRW